MHLAVGSEIGTDRPEQRKTRDHRHQPQPANRTAFSSHHLPDLAWLVRCILVDITSLLAYPTLTVSLGLETLCSGLAKGSTSPWDMQCSQLYI